MNNRQLASVLGILLCIMNGLPSLGAQTPTPKGGPIFSMPKTVVTLDMEVNKTVQTPGTYCEYLDLFFPGLEPAVKCNGNLLPPLVPRKLGQRQADVKELDKELVKLTADQLLADLVAKRKLAAQKQKQLEAAQKALAEVAKTPSEGPAADNIEKPLKDAVAAQATELKKRQGLSQQIKGDRKKAKQEAKKLGLALDAYLAKLEADVKSTQTALDKAIADLAGAGPKVAELRGALSARCDSQPEFAACAALVKATNDVELARRVAEVASDDAARSDRRAPYTFSTTKIKNFTVSTRGIPDPEEVHDMPFTSGFFKDSEQTFDLEQGTTIQGLKSSTTDHTAEFVMPILKAASGIAGRVLTGKALEAKASGKVLDGEDEFIAFLKAGTTNEGPILEANFKMLSEGRRAQYVAGFKDDSSPVRSGLMLAKRSYLTLADLNEKYTTLLGGSTSQPGIQAVLDANRKSFDTLLSQGWNGASQVVAWTPGYEVTPAKPTQTGGDPKDPNRLQDGQSLLLFKIASSCGLDASGAELIPVRVPFPGNMKCGPLDPADEQPEFKDITLAVARVPSPTVSSAARSRPNQATDPAGLPFMVPADAVVKVTNTGIKLVDPQVLLAQGGFMAHLPLSLFNGTGGVDVTYYQATGALKNVHQKTTAKANAGQVATVGDAILGPLDAKMKADAKADADARTAADELTKWKRITDVLTARKNAEALCREFNISPCLQ
jgi:hypothetical protein